jgi:RNA polymerase sigma-70 factor (ECF subfamily)
MPKPLSEVFSVAVAPLSGGPRRVEASAELEIALAAYIEAAQEPWPDFGLDPLDFVRYLAERAQEGQLPPLRHAPDLWLACACVQRVPAALACFLREHEPMMTRILVRRGASADIAADVRQVLAERLFVSDDRAGRRAKIADYKGLGALKGWVATAAVTTLITQQRADGRRQGERPAWSADDALLGPLDPELEYLKQRYAGQVHDAIVAAVASLTPREKALLRLHLKERLSIDRLGAMYGVNRATAARWLAAAREIVKERTIRQLRARLQLNPRECESLLGLVNSQLEVSVLRHLGPEPDRPEP